jgi:HlyD family secretion protein
LRPTRTDSTRRVGGDSARARRGQFGGAGRGSRGTNAGGGRYIVFAKRNGRPTAVWIRTGLTDLDYSEVVEGLQPGDSVYVLPSASLIQSQQDMRQRMNQITGGGAVPGMQQQQQPSSGTRTGGGAAPRSP